MREALTYSQLKSVLPSFSGIDRIAVRVELPHATIGALPSVVVSGVRPGIDWDKGTLFVETQQPLTPLSPEDLEEIKRVRKEGQSYAMLQAHERWARDFDVLVDSICQLRATLIQQGMSMEDLIHRFGELPRKKGRQIHPKNRT